MKSVKVLFLLSAILIAQASCKALKDDSNDDDTHIVVNVTALKMIATVLNVVADFAVNTINALGDNVATIEEYLRKVETVLVDYAWNVAENKLDEMEQNASDFGKAAIQCVREQESDYKATILDYASQSLACETEKTAATLDTFVPALTAIRDTSGVVLNLTEQFEGCGHDSSAIPCIDELNDEIENDIIELGKTLLSDMADASKLMEGIGESASLCHEDVTNKMKATLEGLSATLSECIQQKYPSDTSVEWP